MSGSSSSRHRRLPVCLFIPRSYGYAKLSFLVPSPPFPPPGRTIPSRRGHKSKLLTPSAIRNPGLIRSSPPSVRLSLGSAPERVNPSQRCGWRISSGRATSAAGRRQDPQGELLLLLRFSFVCSCQAAAGGGACSSDFLSRTRKNHSIRELGGHIAHASWFSAAHGAWASSCRYGVAGQGFDSLAQRKTLLKGGT